MTDSGTQSARTDAAICRKIDVERQQLDAHVTSVEWTTLARNQTGALALLHSALPLQKSVAQGPVESPSFTSLFPLTALNGLQRLRLSVQSVNVAYARR